MAGIITLLTTTASASQQTNINSNPAQIDSISYSIGVLFAYMFQKDFSDVPFDVAMLTKGLTDAASDNAKMPQEDVDKIMYSYIGVYQERSLAAKESGAAMFEDHEECERVSYTFGFNLYPMIAKCGHPAQMDWVTKAIRDSFSNSLIIDIGKANNTINSYYAALYDQRWNNIADQEGVVTTDSGLMYYIKNKGDDFRITDDEDRIKITYTGRVAITNVIFDTTRFEDRSEAQKSSMLAEDPNAATKDSALELMSGQMIKGLQEGLKLIGRGGHILLWIPSELAYGEQGIGSAIDPNTDLYFDVELVDIKTKSEVSVEAFKTSVNQLKEATEGLSQEEISDIILGGSRKLDEKE